jgi:hypothetical protein
MFPCKHLNINVSNYADLQMIMWSYGFNNSNSFFCLFVLPIIFNHTFFFNHLLYSKMLLELGLGMTPKFHSTLRLQTFTPWLRSTPLNLLAHAVTTWDWATSCTAGHNDTHWRLKYTSIHMFNQDSTPIWSLQDSTPFWSLQDPTPIHSTTPLHLLAHALTGAVFKYLYPNCQKNNLLCWKICMHAYCNNILLFVWLDVS